jgi:hypothetical protein
MMSKNNVAFGLERYDEVCAIAFDRYLSTSSISKWLANFVGNYRHHVPAKLLCRICRGKDAADRTPRQRLAELSTIEVNRSRHREPVTIAAWGAQMSKVYAGLLVAIALIAMAAIGTLP